MSQMTDAYAAGLIDGEGCIYLASDQRKGWYSVRVDMGMTTKALPLLDLMEVRYGGRIRQHRAATDRWEAAISWSIFGSKAAAFLSVIQHHLILKAPQAELAISFQRMADSLPRHPNGTATWTEDARRQAGTIRLLIQEFNRKGPNSETEDGWFARLVGETWITPQRDMLSTTGWGEFSGIWPPSGMMRSGRVYQRRRLAPRISGRGSSSWPTPIVSDGHPKGYCGPSLDRRKAKGKSISLAMMVKMWPTPTATDYKGSYSPAQRRRQLANAMMMWPTPVADDTGHRKGSYSQGGTALSTMTGGQLNPRFVEWLMGFPIGWTDLEGSATP